jgi:hypothetical protein
VQVPADCEACGACCAFESATFVPLSVEDLERLAQAGEALAHTESGQAYMRMDDGFCAALERFPGGARCTIYEQRPELCREFRQGSSECRSVLISIRRN